MVNVVSPLIYSELDFVIRRIFMHDEVMRQIVPAGGTWWRVVETLYLAMRNTRPRSTVLYNKAKLGYEILKDVANYDPATFENDDVFFEFVSNVQAFITTQSILQQDEEDAAGRAPRHVQPAGDATRDARHAGVCRERAAEACRSGRRARSTAGAGAHVGGTNGHGSGDWDF